MLFLHSLVVFGLLDNSEDTQFTFKFMFICILGEHKLHFIPALIGPFLEVTLIPQPDLRNVMIPIFHDMMDWEQRRSGNFKQVLCVKLFIKKGLNNKHFKSPNGLEPGVPLVFQGREGIHISACWRGITKASFFSL